MEVKTVKDKVTEYLRSKIITGELAPSQKVNEKTLASHLGVSRAPLREAFRSLENEYLVVNIPRKGSYVTELTIEDSNGVYQVREMIECSAVDLIKKQKIVNFQKIDLDLEASCELSIPFRDDIEGRLRYHQALLDFHIALIELTGNQRLLKLYMAICPSLNRYQFIYLFIPGSGAGKRSVDDHRRFLDYLKRKNHDQAKKVLREHIRYSYEFLKKRLLNSELKEKS
ncbi:MAG: GntR family transcriptional regulator [Desulfobacteraceae bacterium]|nr:GntR family transcriptional regulator [Desulfobacteraceae bacterium]